MKLIYCIVHTHIYNVLYTQVSIYIFIKNNVHYNMNSLISVLFNYFLQEKILDGCKGLSGIANV